jgi:hypothetical protein
MERFVAETQRVVDAAHNLIKLMADDAADMPRHILILVNVASKAEDMRTEGMPMRKILESAAEFGVQMAFVSPLEERHSNLTEKAVKTAQLFIYHRELAMDVCAEFVQSRKNLANYSAWPWPEGPMYEKEYNAAVQEIVKAMLPVVRMPVAPRREA